MITHIMNDATNPPELMVWTMLCGEQCVAFDDGSLVPEVDFVDEANAYKSDCAECHRATTATHGRLVEVSA